MSIPNKIKGSRLARMYVENRFDCIIQIGMSEPQNKNV